MIHVAVAVIREADGRILISRRARDAHQGGLWEFPGGKVEESEQVTEALKRELKEELGIQAGPAAPLCEVRHDYGDLQVLLDVWEIDGYQGQARGLEGQALRRLLPHELHSDDFPVANRPIIRRLQLSRSLAITAPDSRHAKENLRRLIRQHHGLIQLRLPEVTEAEWPAMLEALLSDEQIHARKHRLLLNGAPELARRWQLAGCHLNRHRLARLDSRAGLDALLLGASCHDAAELRAAEALGADYALLSPVQPTTSHPEAQALGWEGFERLIRETRLPVYALGGLQAKDLSLALQHGACGIAGISLFDQLR